MFSRKNLIVNDLQPGEKPTVQESSLLFIIFQKVAIRKTIKSNRMLKNQGV